MKKVVLILLTCGLTQALFCQKTTGQKLDELMNAYCRVNKFNGSVLVSQRGNVLLQKGYGLKNATVKTKNDAASIFQIYSITKTFTSTVILRLVEQKKLSLQDKLSKFYPHFPKGDSITIENLLTHTSGIYDYTRGNNMPDQTETSFITFIERKPLDFSPGTNWSYSNSGYWLLGFIIKKVAGMPYEAAVKHYIFKPCQMAHSGFDFKNLISKDKTTGYEIFSSETKKEAIVYAAPGPFAAGAIYSTVGDLYKYYNGLQSYKIANKESLKKASTPFKNNYGYGWTISSYEGREIVSHGGGAAGYRSNFARVPQEDICIVLLDNTENGEMELLTRKLLDVMYMKPYKIPSEIKIDKSVLEKYVGYYHADLPLTLHISIEDGRLTAEPTGQPKSTLLAQSKNYFYSLEADAYVEFQKNDRGDNDELILHQRGKQFNARRFQPAWGLIGSATSKGWEEKIPDIKLTEDALKKGVWILNKINLNTGELKFRFNNDWNKNYGDNGDDKNLDLYGENIKIVEGIYDIILNFTDEAKPTYRISKKL